MSVEQKIDDLIEALGYDPNEVISVRIEGGYVTVVENVPATKDSSVVERTSKHVIL